jgi:hypothetical protein
MTASQKRAYIALAKNDMEVDNFGFLNNQLVELSLVDEPDESDEESDSGFSDNDVTELF